MDISEIKKFIKNKIETDKLTEKVRGIIKTKKWERQDIKEGFKQSFKPLLKTQEKLSENIIEKNEATIEQLKKNQKSLQDSLNKNQLALTEGLKIMGALVAPPDKDEDEDFKTPEAEKEDPFKQPRKKEDWEFPQEPSKQPLSVNLEKDLTKEEISLLGDMDYIQPSKFLETDPKILNNINIELYNEIQATKDEINTKKRGRPSKKDDEYKKILEERLKVMQNYHRSLRFFLQGMNYVQKGKGIYFNPHHLLDRLELLSGSIIAGNNGVIPEFSQIVHLLHQMKVITNKQLNDLIKIYLTIK